MSNLAKLQECVLLASVQAGQRAMATAIYDRIADAHGPTHTPAFGAIYTTITRLAAKGLLKEETGKDEAGRPRRLFSITAEGRSALQRSAQTMIALGAPAFASG
jgi:DNA-binding PadR family transcriptional regulator